MIIEKSGWYDGADVPQFIADDPDSLMEYLDYHDLLNDMVEEYICNNFDMQDFIHEVLRDGIYMDKESMIQDFKEHEIIAGADFDAGGQWYEWLDAGYDTECD